MAESRNLNSGFLHTSFVDLDFTVAKIITILPTGYRAQHYASSIRISTTDNKQNKPVDQALGVWRRVYRRRAPLSPFRGSFRHKTSFSRRFLSQAIVNTHSGLFLLFHGRSRTVFQYLCAPWLSVPSSIGTLSSATNLVYEPPAEATIVEGVSSCAGLKQALCRIQCSSTGKLSPIRPVT